MCPISVQLSCAGRAGSFVASFHTSIYTFRSFLFHSYRSWGHRVLEQSCIFTHTFYTCTFLLSIMLSIYIHFHFASISIDMGAPDQRALAWHLLLLFFQFAFSRCCCDIYHGLALHGMLDVQVGVHFIFILLRC